MSGAFIIIGLRTFIGLKNKAYIKHSVKIQ